MEHKLSALKQLRQVTLSDEERAYLRGRLAQATVSPLPAAEPLFARGMQHGLRIALSSFLFLVFVGGSISAIASNALPGDPLYTVKTDVNERVKAALISAPEKKVAFAKSRVEKRVSEIKTLAETKTLTKEKKAKAQAALDSTVADLSAELSTLSEESPNTALTVTANLEMSLKADKEEITTTLGQDEAGAAATIEAIDGTLKKVSNEEVKILTKEIDNLAGEIEATPTSAASGDVDFTVDHSDDRDATASTSTPSPTPVSP